MENKYSGFLYSQMKNLHTEFIYDWCYKKRHVFFSYSTGKFSDATIINLSSGRELSVK